MSPLVHFNRRYRDSEGVVHELNAVEEVSERVATRVLSSNAGTIITPAAPEKPTRSRRKAKESEGEGDATGSED